MANPPRPPVRPNGVPVRQAPVKRPELLVSPIWALEEIISWENIDVPKLPENLFLERILPLLTDTSGKANFADWIAVAGTLSRPIDVIDGAGHVLFRVPAMQRTLPTETMQQNKRQSFNAVAEHAMLKQRQSPKAAEAFLTQQLAMRAPKVQPDLAPLHQLNAIFRRYNLPEISISKEAEMQHDTVKRSEGFTGELDDF